MSSWYGNKELYKILRNTGEKAVPRKMFSLLYFIIIIRIKKTTASIDQLQLTEVPLLLTFKGEIISSKC